MNGLVWFRNDLRVDDNASIRRANQECDEVIYLYVLDNSNSDINSLGFKKLGNFRKRFLLETLEELKQNLEGSGAHLWVLRGNTERIIEYFIREAKIEKIYFQAEIATEEKKQENGVIECCQKNNVAVSKSFESVLFDVNEAPFDVSKTPDVFTVFRKKMEKYAEIKAPINSPEALKSSTFKPNEYFLRIHPENEIKHLSNEDSKSAFPFRGGENAALDRIQEYFFDMDLLRTYKEDRNGMIGTDYSSKLSPWLANGSLSPRVVVDYIRKYEQMRVKNSSTYWLIFELIWREYWRYAFIKHKNKFFLIHGISDTQQEWKRNESLFEAWRSGKTGFPIVDANMRELFETGWMSNRGRQIVASFLAKSLGIDWRWGASWFESQLLDYDVYSNWGNWAYVAGVGNDGRDRYFNLMIQAEKYDKQGEFMKLWLPELAEVPGKSLGTLHKWNHSERMMYGLTQDVYPKPIIDLDKNYKELNAKR